MAGIRNVNKEDNTFTFLSACVLLCCCVTHRAGSNQNPLFSSQCQTEEDVRARNLTYTD